MPSKTEIYAPLFQLMSFEEVILATPLFAAMTIVSDTFRPYIEVYGVMALNSMLSMH